MDGLLFDDGKGTGAKFSDDRIYRFQLWRIWDYDLPYLNVIGLNPSTADENIDDPTIRRCVDYAKRWHCGGLFMTNLFAYRATKPKDMMGQRDPIGSDNDHWIIETACAAGTILCAWGNDGFHRNRQSDAMRLLQDYELKCLGFNSNQTPKHPLYQRADAEPILFIGR